MPRASRVSKPPAAAAKNVSSSGSHSDPSCSASLYQTFRPVTRSMTRVPSAIVASPNLKGGGSASTSTRRSISDASFSIQSAALRPTVTHARTPHKVTTSAWKPITQPVALSEGQKCASLTTVKPTAHKATTSTWKPLTQPVVLSEGQKCASITTMNPTAKRSRVASTRSAKDSSHSTSKANSIALSGKNDRDEEIMSQGDQSDAAVMPSPTKKLQTCKLPSDTCSKRVSSIRILGGKVPAPLPTWKTEIGKNPAIGPATTEIGKNPAIGPATTEIGKNPAVVPAKFVSSSANGISLPADAAVPIPAQQMQPDPSQNSSVITESVNKEASQVQLLSAKVVNLPPRQKLQTDYQKMTSKVPMMPNQVSGLAGTTAPMAVPKLQIGNMKDTSNVISNPSYARALFLKQQQQLLQQYNLGSSLQQQQQQEQHQELYIKGPALPWSDEAPPIEPLGTRCDLCKLDIAFRPRGDVRRDVSAPPVVAVLACHHAFHSRCIEAVYGLTEPSQCIACVEAGVLH